MRNKNIWILLGTAMVILLLLAASRLFSGPDAMETDGAPTMVPSEAPSPQTTSDEADTTAVPVRAYLLVTVGGVPYQPLPLTQEGNYTITQKATGAENVIHVSTEGVYMKSSTCENHDCVQQGEVTLTNKDTRILGNMIICLPNQVTLELYSEQELRDALPAPSVEP